MKGELIFKTSPWEHQIKAVKYLIDKDYAALFTDMGTGKTKIMIDVVQNRRFKRVLVVATNKACEVWEQQVQIHGFSDRVRAVRLNQLSSEKAAKTILSLPKEESLTHILIINYEKVWRPEVSKVLMYKRVGIDCVICDESHRIKSPGSSCSRFLTKLGKATHYRFLVTGTPLAETPIDIYAQYRFLQPSIFGTNFSKFRDEYENIDPVLTARIGFRMVDKKNPYKNLDKLKEKMYSCAFYVESSIKLPKQTDIVCTYKIPDKTYEKVYKPMVKEGIVILNGRVAEVENALAKISRTQQILSGFLPAEDDDGEVKTVNLDRSRVEFFKEVLKSCPDKEPVVVFANYRKDLKEIKRACKDLGIKSSELSGSEDTMSDWKEGKTRVLAVQYSSGSESIDLTRARFCIYYTLTSKLGLYLQSKKRIHRPGQTRAVSYFHILCRLPKGKSIDELAYEALKNKKDVVTYVMDKDPKNFENRY